MKLVIRNGRIIDPANDRDEVAALFVVDGKIASADDYEQSTADAEEIDAAGKVVAPGLIDIHVHLREPGQSAKETIESGTRAAAAGGFTSVVCMPNTSPVIDDPSAVTWLQNRITKKAIVNVFPVGAITRKLAGEELTPIGSMLQCGIVAISDDGKCVQNHGLMRRATEYARMFDIPIIDHCQDYSLVQDGVMNEGYWSGVLGLPGWPAAGEELIVLRNILLAEHYYSRIHCQHITCAGSIRHIREARKRDIPISAEVCPHHIALTDENIQSFDPNYKMNPPLRTAADIDALIEGIADGTVSVLASDHAPHCPYEKEVEFDFAPFGIIGLETELGLFIDILIHKKKAIDLPRLIAMFTIEPAKLLKLNRGTLSAGVPADITIIDPELEWQVDLEQSESLSRNSPFSGWQLKGRATRTIVAGETVFST